ncbi:DUF4424 family protein [Xanthomonas phaseoli]|uniref:DUF4424 family protein n=1 Tax=Xanthomonas phaseoli TaxID=1985254 RepID=UPI002B4B97F5|nr:DUF4424 family protein [Xanthomonas phaseoli]
MQVVFLILPMYYRMADNNALSDFKLWADSKPAATAPSRLCCWMTAARAPPAFAATGWTQDNIAAFTAPATPPNGCKPLPAHWVDGDGPARFTLNAYFVWQQEFPAKVSVQIRHISTPACPPAFRSPAASGWSHMQRHLYRTGGQGQHAAS